MCILWMEGCMLRISNFKPYNSQLVTSAVIWSRHEPFLLQAMIFLVGTKNWHLWLVPIWKPVTHWLVVKSDWLTIKNETLTHAKKSALSIWGVDFWCWSAGSHPLGTRMRLSLFFQSWSPADSMPPAVHINSNNKSMLHLQCFVFESVWSWRNIILSLTSMSDVLNDETQRKYIQV